MTTHSSQASGTNAMTNDKTKSIVAMLFLIRRPMTDRLNRRSFDRQVEGGGAHVLTALPTIARATALTMNVRTNSTNPAAI